MGVERFTAALRRHHRIAIDTSIFIYHLEISPRFASFADAVFAWLERPGVSAVTSTITMAELLVAPYRQSNLQRVDEFYALLTTYPQLTWVPPGLEIADSAARLRDAYRLRTPDALQAATAEYSQASAFITNDLAFSRVLPFVSLVLEKFV